MIERLKENRGGFMLLSILLALLFWFYVRSVDNSTYSAWFYNVPVVQSGSNVLATQSLTVAGLSQNTVDLRIEAPAAVLEILRKDRDDLWVTVDVSRCQEGENRLSYTFSWPVSVSRESIAVQEQSPRTITATVERVSNKSFPVEFQLKGKVADGYEAGTAAVNPETVQVSGPVEQVSRVARVVAVLEDEELTERFAGDLPLTLLDAEGEELTDLEVTLDSKSAYVVVPVVVMKEIPLTVKVVPGGGAAAYDAEIDIEPRTIMVSGAEEDLRELEEISLGSVDLAKVVGAGTITKPIELDASLENVSGITSASVSVTITGLYTKTFDVDNIILGDPAEGFQAAAVTQIRTVMVRGQKEAVEAVDASQIRIVVDVSSYTNLGAYSVPARVYLDAGDSVGVIGDYYISVTISR